MCVRGLSEGPPRRFREGDLPHLLPTKAPRPKRTSKKRVHLSNLASCRLPCSSWGCWAGAPGILSWVRMSRRLAKLSVETHPPWAEFMKFSLHATCVLHATCTVASKPPRGDRPGEARTGTRLKWGSSEATRPVGRAAPSMRKRAVAHPQRPCWPESAASEDVPRALRRCQEGGGRFFRVIFVFVTGREYGFNAPTPQHRASRNRN